MIDAAKQHSGTRNLRSGRPGRKTDERTKLISGQEQTLAQALVEYRPSPVGAGRDPVNRYQSRQSGPTALRDHLHPADPGR